MSPRRSPTWSHRHSAPRGARLEFLEQRRLLTGALTAPAICGTVYSDGNLNGVVDAGEGLAGVTVRLYRDNGDGIFSSSDDLLAIPDQTTDSQGGYQFEALLADATYFVEQPAQTVAGRNLPARTSLLQSPTLPTSSIDEFRGSLSLTVGSAQFTAAGTTSDSSILGTERDVALEGDQSSNFELQIDGDSPGTLTLRSFPFGSTQPIGRARIIWDGIDDDALSNAFQLGPLDFTANGSNSGFLLRAGSNLADTTIQLAIYDGTTTGNTANRSIATVTLPVIDQGSPTGVVFVPFTSLVGSVLPNAVATLELELPEQLNGLISIDSIGLIGSRIADFANDAQVDVRVSITNNQTSVIRNDLTAYTVVVENRGPDPADNTRMATILDQLEQVTYTSTASGGATGNRANGVGPVDELINLPAGGSVTYLISARVRSDATAPVTSQAIATVDDRLTETDPDNNSATDTDSVNNSADLNVLVADDLQQVLPGDTIDYRLTVNNLGPSVANDVLVRSLLPPELIATARFTSSSSGGASGATPAGTGSIDEVVVLPPGSSIVYVLTLDLPLPTSLDTLVVSATAAHGDNTLDANAANNTASDTNEVIPLVPITGRVVEDMQGDGISTTDVGRVGQGVRLFRDNLNGQFDAADTLVARVTTDANGNYAFAGQRPGTYFVQLEVPADALVTEGGSPQQLDVAIVIVEIDVPVASRDFALFELVTLTGIVWQDVQGNGITSDDIPLPNTVVELYRDNGNSLFDPTTDTLAETTITIADGSYRFSSLEPGTYFLVQLTPDHFVTTVAGPNDAGSYQIVATSGLDRNDLEFAVARLGEITGNVFVDTDRNGEFDAAEVGVARWTVQLLNAAGEVLATAQTDNDGFYRFEDVAPGNYRVVRSDQPGWEQTGPAARFDSTLALSTFGMVTGPVAAADLDGDGIPELISVSDVPASIDILRRETSGYRLWRSVSLPTLSRPQAVLAADLDGDGDQDLAVPTIGMPTSPTPQNPTPQANAVLLFTNDGTGGWDDISTIPAGHGPIHLASGDLNQDGRVDLVVTNFRSHTIDILQNLGARQFRVVQTIVVGSDPLATEVADLDADGLLDVVVAVYGADEILWLRQQGSGNFAPVRRWSVSQPTDIDLSDLDQDGQPDLVVTSRGDDRLSVFFGEADDSERQPFAEQRHWSVDSNPRSVTVGDLNGDDAPDVVVTTPESSRIAVLYGASSRTLLEPFYFTPANPAPGYTPAPQRSLLVDADGDGDLDIVVGQQLKGLSLLLNQPSAIEVDVIFGSLREGAHFGQISTVSSVARQGTLSAAPTEPAVEPLVWDVNGDGHVSAVDALLIINHLNRQEAFTDALRSLDTNRDGAVSAIDALLVINRLNAMSKLAKTESSGLTSPMVDEVWRSGN